MKNVKFILAALFFSTFLHAELSPPRMTNLKAHPSLYVDVGIYGSLDLWEADLTPGISIRTQQDEHGLEFDASGLWHASFAKISASYLYHVDGNRSGLYFGGGPTYVKIRYFPFRPGISAFMGYQYSSNYSAHKQFHGFVDIGATRVFADYEGRLAISASNPVATPIIRVGTGLSF